jgi:hypothetical protein
VLDAYTVPLILIALTTLSFPYGYVAMSTIQKHTKFVLPFFVVLPSYLAIGICILILICMAIPSLLVSPYILIIATIVGYIFTIRINNSIRRTQRKENLKVNTGDAKQFMIEFIGKRVKTPPNIFSLCIIIFVFSFFAVIVANQSWPPIGNAVLDSSLTALTIDRAFVINDTPFSAFPLAYPVGYHSISANLSLLFDIYPAEAVYIFASFLLSVTGCLLFSLTYILTRSLWISLPSAFTIFIISISSGPSNLIGGFLFEGPYPAIFGLMAVITLILQLQVFVSYKFPSILKTLPLIVIILLSVFVSYPNFLVLGLIVVGIYYLVQSHKGTLFLSKRSKDKLTAFIKSPKHAYHLSKSMIRRKEPRIETTPIRMTLPTSGENRYHSSSKNMSNISPNIRAGETVRNILLGLLILLIFAVPFILFDLSSYYSKISPAFDTVYFEDFDGTVDLFQSLVDGWTVLSSNFYLASLIVLDLAIAVTMLIINARAIPLYLICVVLFAVVFLSSMSFVNPVITASLLGSLSFTIIAYSIRQILKIKGWINNRRNIAAVAGFACVSIVVQIPYIMNYAAAADVSMLLPEYDQFYTIGQWLDANISKADRVLNDRSLSGFYLDGFFLMNLTHTYSSDFLVSRSSTESRDSSKEQAMINEFNAVIWHNPNEPELVYPLLKYYNISYIILLPESGFKDIATLGGSEIYMKKPFSNKLYAQYFDSYDFLKSNLSSAGGSSGIYRVE